MAKNVKIVWLLILIAQKKRFDTLNAAQKNTALYNKLFMKKSIIPNKNGLKNGIFEEEKNIFLELFLPLQVGQEYM